MSIRTIMIAVLCTCAVTTQQATSQQTTPSSAGRPAQQTQDSTTLNARWRQAHRQLKEWLSVQKIYTPQQAQALLEHVERRSASMSSAELEDLVDEMDDKLQVLMSPAAADATCTSLILASTCVTASASRRASTCAATADSWWHPRRSIARAGATAGFRAMLPTRRARRRYRTGCSRSPAAMRRAPVMGSRGGAAVCARRCPRASATTPSRRSRGICSGTGSTPPSPAS